MATPVAFGDLVVVAVAVAVSVAVAVLVGVLGVEGPAGGGVVPAIEAGFGGGVRVGVALRRAMRNRR